MVLKRMAEKQIKLGIVLKGCDAKRPCLHCMAYPYVGKEILDFNVVEKIAEEIKNGKIGDRIVGNIVFSEGEPISYNSNNKTLADVIALLIDSCQSITIHTSGIKENNSFELKTLEQITEIAKIKNKVTFWFSLNKYAQYDQKEYILRTLSQLNKMGFPCLTGNDDNFRSTKRIAVNTDNRTFLDSYMEVKEFMKSMGYSGIKVKKPYIESIFVNNSNNDQVHVKLGSLVNMGLAKKKLKDTKYSTLTTCLRFDEGFILFIHNDKTIGFCEVFSILKLKPFGVYGEKSLTYALKERERFTSAVKSMVESMPDLSQYNGQICGYCEDNLIKYLK